jgi:hypothetical protein
MGVLVFLIYVGDSLSIRFHFPHRDPFGTVQVQPYYAVRLKNHRIEYTMADPETETCVHSLFPQSGYTPCWYLSRHTQRRIDIDSLLPVPEMVSASLQAEKAPAKRRFSQANRPAGRFLLLRNSARPTPAEAQPHFPIGVDRGLPRS